MNRPKFQWILFTGIFLALKIPRDPNWSFVNYNGRVRASPLLVWECSNVCTNPDTGMHLNITRERRMNILRRRGKRYEDNHFLYRKFNSSYSKSEFTGDIRGWANWSSRWWIIMIAIIENKKTVLKCHEIKNFDRNSCSMKKMKSESTYESQSFNLRVRESFHAIFHFYIHCYIHWCVYV